MRHCWRKQGLASRETDGSRIRSWKCVNTGYSKTRITYPGPAPQRTKSVIIRDEKGQEINNG